MLKNIEELLVWGAIGGVLAMIFRPFINIPQKIRDGFVGFGAGFLVMLLLDYFPDLSCAVKGGISGLSAIFALDIFNGFSSYIKRFFKNPAGELNRFVGRDNRGRFTKK